MACYKQDVRGKQIGWLSEMILGLDKLGKIIKCTEFINFLWILVIVVSMETDLLPAWHYNYLKMLVLVTTMGVPNFMLVS